MNAWSRRDVLKTGSAAALALSWGPTRSERFAGSTVKASTFTVDVSPPKGHSCCGGWIQPVVEVSDSLQAIGLLLTGDFRPIVLCAVDWTGILNEAHLAWRQAIAEAVGTDADRVAVQCVHQHNAPFACLESNRIVGAHDGLPLMVEPDYFEKCVHDVAAAARRSLESAVEISHVGVSTAVVEKVASNRRILGADGRVEHWRGSSSRNPIHQELPEGLIDPVLKSISLFRGDTRVCALHYYATHPMSFYGDGLVTSDFVGLARKRLQEREPDCRHLYFTGCSGNIAAGKYNDGSPEARVQLTDRVFDALSRSVDRIERFPVSQMTWRTRELLPTPRETLDESGLLEQIADPSRRLVDRNRPAFQVAWLRRVRAEVPIVLSSLDFGPAISLHLPAESFIEYQLAASDWSPEKIVCTAAYGDGGPWYIPTADAYPQGGYEVTVAFCDPTVDAGMRAGIRPLVTE